MKKIKLFISIISLMFIMCFFVSNNVAHAASSPLNINDAEKLINSVNTYDATVSEEIEYDQSPCGTVQRFSGHYDQW